MSEPLEKMASWPNRDGSTLTEQNQNQGAVVHDPTPHQDRDGPLSTKDFQRKSRSKDLHVDPNKCDEAAAGNLPMVSDSIVDIDDLGNTCLHSQTAVNFAGLVTDSTHHNSSHLSGVVEQRPISPVLAHRPGSRHPVVTGSQPSNASQSSSGFTQGAVPQSNDAGQGGNFCQTGNPSSGEDSYTSLCQELNDQEKLNSQLKEENAQQRRLLDDSTTMKAEHQDSLRKLCEAFRLYDEQINSLNHLIEFQNQERQALERMNSQLQKENAEQRRLEAENQDSLRKLYELCRIKDQENDTMKEAFRLYDAEINSLSHLIEAQNQERLEMRKTMDELTQFCQENLQSLTQRVQEDCERRVRLEYEQQLEDLSEENERLRNLVTQLRSREEPQSEDSPSPSISERLVEDVDPEGTLSDVASDEWSSSSSSSEETGETVEEMRQFRENERSFSQRVEEERARLRLEFEQKLEQRMQEMHVAMTNAETAELQKHERELEMLKRESQKEKEEKERLQDLVMQLRSRKEPLLEASPGTSNNEDFVDVDPDTPSDVASDDHNSSSRSSSEEHCGYEEQLKKEMQEMSAKLQKQNQLYQQACWANGRMKEVVRLQAGRIDYQHQLIETNNREKQDNGEYQHRLEQDLQKEREENERLRDQLRSREEPLLGADEPASRSSDEGYVSQPSSPQPNEVANDPYQVPQDFLDEDGDWDSEL